ncbi:hypothetical protein OF83DRAFT_1091221 [Amylostereum chailletii]|nr:hypothetical protein OF83DRAFT_1091221 [Amylostereum chailletii]
MQGSKSHGRRDSRHAGLHSRTNGDEDTRKKGSAKNSGVRYPDGSLKMVRDYVEESPQCDSLGVWRPRNRMFETDAMRAFGEQEVRRLSNEIRKLILYSGCLCIILAPLLLRSLSTTATANANSALAAQASSLFAQIEAQYAAHNQTSPLSGLTAAHLFLPPPPPGGPDHYANMLWTASIVIGLMCVAAGAALRTRARAPSGIHHLQMDRGARAVRLGAWIAAGLYVAGMADLARAVGMRLGGISAFLGASAVVVGICLGLMFVARAREREN